MTWSDSTVKLDDPSTPEHDRSSPALPHRKAIARRTPLRPSTARIPRHTRVKSSRKPIRARKKDPGKRAFAARRCKPYREWIKTLPCLLRGHPRHVCDGVVEPSHVGSRGAGHNDIGEIIPLCGGGHRTDPKAWHKLGRHSFPKYWGYETLDTLEIIACAYGETWLSTSAGIAWQAEHPESAA